MALMPPQDSMFLIPESREQPMHVGSLQLFELPEGADRSLIRETYEGLIASNDVVPLCRRRQLRSEAVRVLEAWAAHAALALDNPVLFSALPEPGRVRELLALV